MTATAMPDIRATTISRLYADDFGESRFETVTVPLSEKDFAPPAAPLYCTDAQPAQHYAFLSFLSIGVGPSHTRLQVDTCFFAWLADFA
jgi:hypothetical protein